MTTQAIRAKILTSKHGKLLGLDANERLIFKGQWLGDSSNKWDAGTTGENLNQAYVDATHTTGDYRLRYERLYFSGVGGSGEVYRAFATVNNVTAGTGGTVNGIHASLSINGASGKIAGTGSTPGGTLAALQVDSDIASGVTLPASHAFIRFTNTGAVSLSRLLEVPDVASGGLLAAHVTDGVSHSIRIRSADGTLYYLMATTTTSNRTGGA
jgi:hypothetical protein